jgi:hypothetical protein
LVLELTSSRNGLDALLQAGAPSAVAEVDDESFGADLAQIDFVDFVGTSFPINQDCLPDQLHGSRDLRQKVLKSENVTGG